MADEERPKLVRECPRCAEHYRANPMLIGACASVGIERGKSTWQMVEDYLAEFHRRKHRG